MSSNKVPDYSNRVVAEVRPMDAVDLERILELRESVRWSADPAAFELLRGFDGARWAVAATESGQLVGMIGAVPFGGIGVICHLAVHGSVRRRGIGNRLAEWAVWYLTSRGASTVRLESTPEAEGLYRSLGFRAVARRALYRDGGGGTGQKRARSLLRESAGDEYEVSPLVIGDLAEVYGLDLWSFGADRSDLLQAILRLHPGWGMAARDAGGRMVGYLIQTTTRAGCRFGPFMAAEAAVARALLSRALKDSGTATGTRGPPARSPELLVPGGPEGRFARELLEEFGFVGAPDRLRMELGEPAEPRGLRTYGMTPYLST